MSRDADIIVGPGAGPAMPARTSTVDQQFLCKTIKGKPVLVNPNHVIFVEVSRNQKMNILFLKYDRGEGPGDDLYLAVQGTMDSYLAALRKLRLNPGLAFVTLLPNWTQKGEEPDLNEIIPDEDAVKA